MEFDLSKENIQPLRGGRNVSQLEVALQAQSDVEVQRELLQQKGAFEEAIRTYEGEDPLDNWYNYISWVEQSYPKHGHEGNLVPLLEDCLSKFEHDDRYFHDRRFCKLWIKYIDLQQNPLELFQLLYSKGICKSCADLYRAWAYYHEAVGDYKRADTIFQLGLRDMAQPYEDLVYAHKNMYEAIGRQTIQGVDERRLMEQRQALTSLRSYKHNHRTVVPSVRVGNQVLNSAPGALQQNTARSERNSNVPINLYEDPTVAGPSVGGACAVVSILDVARKQEVHKENTLKPGTWKKGIINKKLPQNHAPSFTVHEDEDQQYAGGIRLPPNFYPTNDDDFSDWVGEIYFPEPHDPSHVPMYPKHLVYAEQNIEYSLEEIRARKWLIKKQERGNASITMQETMMEEANIINRSRHNEVEQAVQSILPQTNEREFNADLQHGQPNYNVAQQHMHSESVAQQHMHNESVATNSYALHGVHLNEPQFSMSQQMHHQSQVVSRANQNFNPELQNSLMYRQPYMAQNISGFHLANSTKNPDLPVNQTSGLGINSASGQNVPSHMYHHHYSQDEMSLPKVATSVNNSVERFFNQNQNNSKTDFYHHQNEPSSSSSRTTVETTHHLNTSTHLYQQHQPVYQSHTSQVDNSAKMYQPHIQPFSQPVSIYQSNDTSQLINSSTKLFQHNESQQAQHQQWMPNNSAILQKSQQQWPNNTMSSDDNYTVNMRAAIKDIHEIWKDSSTTNIQLQVEVKKPEINKFQIHEDTNHQLQKSDNKIVVNTGVKRSPFAVVSEEEKPTEANNDTNKLHFSMYEDDKQKSPPQKLRTNMRAQFSNTNEPEPPLVRKSPFKDDFAKPTDVKKPAPFTVFEETANSGPSGFVQPLNDSCTTQAFNFNLNQLKASTPFNYKKVTAQQFANANVFNNEQPEPMKQTKKVLFDQEKEIEETAAIKKSENWFSTQEETRQQDKLSVIFENSKESRYSSSSSSCGTTLKTTTFHRESLKVIPETSNITEESTSKEKESKKTIESTVNYDVLKMFLKDDSNENPGSPVMRKNHIIDLTGDDSMIQNDFKCKEYGGGDAMHVRQSLMTNYESPMKNQFREMSCDSNDSLSCSPVKGNKMDVDIQALITQNSNSEFQMEQETQDVPVHRIDKPVLLKAPSDPLSAQLNTMLLNKIGFPSPKYSSQYFEMQNLPRLVKKEVACFMDEKYVVEKVVGKGAFGCVYKAIDLCTNELVALKYQKPANKWEYYIAKEIRERLNNPYMQNAYMHITACYISPAASVLVSDFFKIGSLLDITNKVKQVSGKGIKELIAIYYASEIITIVNTLHQCKIIHGDIKPDNFLVTKMPPEFGYPSLQLIDFGNSIDMSLFPEGTSFTKVINTENFICTEMKDGRPWTYQTDIFCIAATTHVLLFDKYMQLHKSGKVWSITQHIPRYMRTDLWKTFFFQMLNIEGCDNLPNLNDIKTTFDTIISSQSEELQMDMKAMANHVLGR